MLHFKTIIEPFRIKSVEAVKFTHREDREAAIRDAGFNVFRLHAEDVLIDLPTRAPVRCPPRSGARSCRETGPTPGAGRTTASATW